MKTTELRIGNYFYYEHTTHIVSGVHGNKVYSWWVKDGQPVIEYEAKDISGSQVENPYIDVISQYEPIPLTEEWLEKFGFEWSIWHQAWHKLGFVFDLSERGVVGYYMHIIKRNNDIICPEIIYVHQLQNLYFSLTREELTIK